MKQNNRLIRDDDDEVASPPRLTADVPLQASDEPIAATFRSPARQREARYPGMRQITGFVDGHVFMRLRMISVQTDRLLIELYDVALTRYVHAYNAEKKFSGEGPTPSHLLQRNTVVDGYAVTVRVRAELFKWLRAIHIQTRKSMGLILVEALTAYVNSSAATKRFGVEN